MELNKKPVRVLIDTDIGDDIDDALAIAMALQSPEIEIIGITTVFKNTDSRTQLAKELLYLYGREDIPVYTGVKSPLIERVDCVTPPVQCQVLTKTHPVNEDMSAVEFIIKTVRDSPDVLILPIGPQTNIALAFLQAPEIMKMAKLVSMGGVFTAVYPEWNIFCDPEAARVVADYAQEYILVGLDVTTQVTLGEKEIAKIKTSESPCAKFLYSLIQKWFDSSGHCVTLHDPLVIGYLINPSLLTLAPINLKVELNGGLTRAVTFVDKNPFLAKQEAPKKQTQIATHVKAEEFLKLFMERVFP